MKYFLVNQQQDLMRNTFFYYRQNMKVNEDSIVALVKDERSSFNEIIEMQKQLLNLEGEFRTKFNKWECPPVRLESMLLPKISIKKGANTSS